MSEPKDPIIEVLDFQATPATAFEPCPVLCPECGWHGHWGDCETEWESDGWETPEYKVAVCPICGCTVDYN